LAFEAVQITMLKRKLLLVVEKFGD